MMTVYASQHGAALTQIFSIITYSPCLLPSSISMPYIGQQREEAGLLAPGSALVIENSDV
jgi:hypothetical protein